MSQDVERVYTINLGKVLLSQSQHRAVRAINMIREFARHHMKTETVKIEEELAQKIWERGVRSPPRKIRVRMSKNDEGHIIVSLYDEEAESKIIEDLDAAKKTDAGDDAKTPESDPGPAGDAPGPDAPVQDAKPDAPEQDAKPDTTEQDTQPKQDAKPDAPEQDAKPDTPEPDAKQDTQPKQDAKPDAPKQDAKPDTAKQDAEKPAPSDASKDPGSGPEDKPGSK